MSPTELDTVRLVTVTVPGPLQLWREKLPTTSMETPRGRERRTLSNILTLLVQASIRLLKNVQRGQEQTPSLEQQRNNMKRRGVRM